jgi:hypothetical protein
MEPADLTPHEKMFQYARGAASSYAVFVQSKHYTTVFDIPKIILNKVAGLWHQIAATPPGLALYIHHKLRLPNQ